MKMRTIGVPVRCAVGLQAFGAMEAVHCIQFFFAARDWTFFAIACRTRQYDKNRSWNENENRTQTTTTSSTNKRTKKKETSATIEFNEWLLLIRAVQCVEIDLYTLICSDRLMEKGF